VFRITFQALELSRNEEILADAQHFAHLGHWQFDMMGKGKLLWSAETYRIFERDPAIGPPTIDELVAYAVASDRKRWRAVLDSSMLAKGGYEIDIVIEPRPGIQKHLHERGRPVFNESGIQVRRFGTVQDVTEARLAEAALRRSEEFLSALYDNIPLGLGAVEQRSGDWVFISINPAAVRLLSLTAPPSAGSSLVNSGLALERSKQWDELLRQGVDATEPLSVELCYEDVHQIHFVTIVPLDSDDDCRRCFFLIADITEKKQQIQNS
jgi:PAS domain-containing protein